MSFWKLLGGSSTPEKQSKSHEKQSKSKRPRFTPRYDNNIQNVNLIEDLVENQTSKNQNNKSNKYQDLNISDLMSISIDLAKDKLKLSSSDQDHAVKISISESKLEELEKQLAEDDDSDQASLDVFCVIDRSGSMAGKRLQEVRQSLKYLLDLLKPDDRISIILFDCTSELYLAPKKIGESREIIENAINSIVDRGATNIRAGLETAFNAMIDRKSKNSVTGVLLLSDGQDNQNFHNGGYVVDKFFEDWAPKLKDHEHTIHTFGYGDGHDDKLLDQINKAKGGNFYYVKDLELVSDNFVDCLGGLSSVIGQNAKITLNLRGQEIFSEIRFKKTYGGLFSGEKETERTIELSNITKGYNKDFIFEITLNGAKNPDILETDFKNLRLIDVKFSADNLTGKTYEKDIGLDVDVYNQSENIEIISNEDVRKHHIRVKGSEAITQAQDFADNNNYKGGEDLLDLMEKELDNFKDDIVMMDMKDNIIKQKKMINQTSKGIDCGMNMKAFSRNMCNTYAYQESAPAFCGDIYQNACQSKMKNRLTKMKK